MIAEKNIDSETSKDHLTDKKDIDTVIKDHLKDRIAKK